MKIALTATTLKITFSGDLLSTNIDALRTEILAALTEHSSTQTVVADLSNARLVDSKGVNLLLALYRETQRRKIDFRAENPSADVRRLLALLNLQERFGLTA
jgi:anti-anti-sigma factor